MCYSPIKIKTNKVQYRNGIDPVYLTVPCGKCRECRQSQEDDWFVRIYYEWLQVKKSGGKCYFVTLTYNDSELPIIDTSEDVYYSFDIFLRNYFSGEYALSDSIRNNFLDKVGRYESRYNRSALERPVFACPRFDKESICNFFKSLRQLLDYNKILRYEDSLQLRYFCSTEYGSEENTRRPHYHALIFMPVPIDDGEFLKLCRRAWSHRVKKSDFPEWLKDIEFDLRKRSAYGSYVYSTPGTKWNDWYVIFDKKLNRFNVFHSRGFVNYSKEHGASITSIDGCKYITSYLHYYDVVLKNDFYEMIKDYEKLFPSFSDIKHLPKLSECLRHIRDIFPFTVSSQRFGFEFYVECGLDGKLSDDDKLFLRRNQITLPAHTRKYRIPQYLLNRLLYNDDAVPYAEKRVRLLSSDGADVLSKAFEQKLDFKIRQYSETINILRKFLIPDDFKSFLVDYSFNTSSHNKNLLVDFLTTHIGFDLKHIALYDLVFRNVVYHESGDSLLFNSMSGVDILENAYDLFARQVESKMHFDLYYKDDFLSSYSNRIISSLCFNTLPQLVGCENFLLAHYYIRKCVLSRDASHYYDDEKKQSRVRSALDQFIYKS